jgi:hypothetical protein
VVVQFVEGDPDRPLVIGSVYNAEQIPPYLLPDHATISTFRSRSSKQGVAANPNLDPAVDRLPLIETRAHQRLVYPATFTTSVRSAARPLVWRFVPLPALLLLVGRSPLRRRALPATRLASPSGAPNCRIHHACFFYAHDKDTAKPICLGGNQSDQINFTMFKESVRYFVPSSYFEAATQEIKNVPQQSATAADLNTEFGIVTSSKNHGSTR